MKHRTIWDLAEKAQAEVDKWPEWKRRAADTALCEESQRRLRVERAKALRGDS